MGLVNIIYLKNGDHLIPPYRGVGLIGFGPRAIKSAFREFGFFGFLYSQFITDGTAPLPSAGAARSGAQAATFLPGELA